MNALVVIPTYNEADNIEPLVYAILNQAGLNVHVLIVDDGSPDGTGDIADQLAQSADLSGRLFVLHRPQKNGLGRAYLAGFAWALDRDYDAAVEMDADFSHDPMYLPRLIEAADNADVVIGSRYLNGISVINWPLQRILLSWGANQYVQKITRLQVHDCTSGFRLYHRRVLEAIDLPSVRSNGLLVPSRDDVPGAPGWLSHCRSAHYLCRTPRRSIEDEQTGDLGVDADACQTALAGAMAAAQTSPAGCGSVVDGDDSSRGSPLMEMLRHRRDLWAIPLLFLLGIVMRAADLKRPFRGIYSWNEAYYSIVAVNFSHYGLTRQVGPDGPLFTSNPLVPWMIAASFHYFGQTEIAARLPFFLLSLISLAAIYGIARAQYPNRPAVARWCLLLAATMPGIVFFSRNVQLDGPMTAFGLGRDLACDTFPEQPTPGLAAPVAFGTGTLPDTEIYRRADAIPAWWIALGLSKRD